MKGLQGAVHAMRAEGVDGVEGTSGDGEVACADGAEAWAFNTEVQGDAPRGFDPTAA